MSIIAILHITIIANAQSDHTIFERVVNEQGQGIEYVNIGIPKDTVFTVSDINGYFSLDIPKSKTNSDEYGTVLFEEAQKILPNYGMTLRKDMTDGDPDYENFTVIYKTKCPSALVCV